MISAFCNFRLLGLGLSVLVTGLNLGWLEEVARSLGKSRKEGQGDHVF